MLRIRTVVVLGVVLLQGLQVLHCQEERTSHEGPTIEIGALYGQLMWKALENSPYHGAQEFNRSQFIIYPTARVAYVFTLTDDLFASPFVAYARLGGKSDRGPAGYEDQFKLDAVQTGTFVGVRWGLVDIAIGAGLDYYFRKVQQSRISSVTLRWEEHEEEFFLKDFGFEGGIRIAGNIDHFVVAAEGWYGIVPMQKSEFSDAIVIRQNSIRFLIGYRLF